MAAYLKSWLFVSPTPEPVSQSSLRVEVDPPPPESPDHHDADPNDADDDDDDLIPQFPSPNSIQRAAPQVSRSPSNSTLMPPPSFLPSSKSTGTSNSRALQLPPSTTSKPKPKSRKVALAPGHSPLDWARLTSSGKDLRGVTELYRVTPSMLKIHNKKDDAWSSFNGKVYNITPYLPFHPGGESELMRVAGRDGTKLFAATHGWVNVDMMLDACLVGFLVPERNSS